MKKYFFRILMIDGAFHGFMVIENCIIDHFDNIIILALAGALMVLASIAMFYGVAQNLIKMIKAANPGM